MNDLEHLMSDAEQASEASSVASEKVRLYFKQLFRTYPSAKWNAEVAFREIYNEGVKGKSDK